MNEMDRDARERLEEWISRFAQQSERVRDDRHLDQLNATYKSVATWASGALECFMAAGSIARQQDLAITVAVELFLKGEQSALGAPSGPLTDLQFSWTPPAVTLYKRGAEPWVASSSFVEIPLPTDISDGRGTRALYQEWYDEDEEEFDRRVWLVTP